MNAESQGTMSSLRRFEMCVLGKTWRWDHGTPPMSEWSPLREAQNERVRLGTTYVYMGKHKYSCIVNDSSSGLMIYECNVTHRIMIREIGPALLLSIHAKHIPNENSVLYLCQDTVCFGLLNLRCRVWFGCRFGPVHGFCLVHDEGMHSRALFMFCCFLIAKDSN